MAWTAPRTYVASETLTAAIMNSDHRDNLNAGFPTGSLHYYIRAATTTETLINAFALECNGVAPLRATYSALNTLLSGLGYPFGSGNGSTTFTLPDIQGRGLVAMASGGHADVNGLGDSDGLAKASRSPQHNSSNNLTGELATDVGTEFNTFGVAAGSATNAVNSVTQDAVDVVFGGTIGPGGTRPTDTVPFLVAGVYAVKV